MRCDLNCPYRKPHCCCGCQCGRQYLKDVYPDKWSDENGFRSDKGCRLSREEMPQECKGYDCKQYIFYSTVSYDNGKWIVTGLHEILDEDRDREFIDKYNALFKDLRNAS